MCRRWGASAGLLATLSVATSALAASPAHATIFDSANEPPAIENPGVATQSGAGSWLEIELTSSLVCPAAKRVSYTVSITDPTGSISLSMRKPFSQAEPCENPTYWLPASQQGEALDFSARGQDSRAPRVWFTPDETTPFLFQVTGPGGIVARRAMTAKVTSAEKIWQFREPVTFAEFCVDGSRELKSENGELFCTFGRAVSYQAGWPPSAPAVRAAPRPRFGALTAASAGRWARVAVQLKFRYRPTRFRAAGCARSGAARFSCRVSWRHGAYAFAGTAQVGALNVYTGHFTYGLQVVRTDLRTRARRSFFLAY
jgi:hypothetical protein